MYFDYYNFTGRFVGLANCVMEYIYYLVSKLQFSLHINFTDHSPHQHCDLFYLSLSSLSLQFSSATTALPTATIYRCQIYPPITTIYLGQSYPTTITADPRYHYPPQFIQVTSILPTITIYFSYHYFLTITEFN